MQVKEKDLSKLLQKKDVELVRAIVRELAQEAWNSMCFLCRTIVEQGRFDLLRYGIGEPSGVSFLIGSWKVLREHINERRKREDGMLYIWGVKRNDDKVIKIQKHDYYNLFIANGSWIVFGLIKLLPILAVRVWDAYSIQKQITIDPDDTIVLACWVYKVVKQNVHENVEKI